MSTNKNKPHSSRKTKGKARKGGARKGKKGLRGPGATKMASTKKGLSAIAKPGGAVLGFVLSALAGMGIDKLKFLEIDTTKPADVFQAKSLVKPALLLAAGATTAYLSRKNTAKPTMQFVNGLGWGFVFGGTFNVVKVVEKVMKKDFFKGLSGGENTESAKALAAAEFNRANANDTAALLEANRHLIELPEFQSAARDAVSGAGMGESSNYNSEMRAGEMIL